MALDPGQMRDRIEIWKATPGDWDHPVIFVHRCTIWCKVRYQSGREFRENSVAAGSEIATFSIRWRDDIDQADEIRFAGQRWDIAAIVPVGFKAGLDINARSIGPAP